ncbi:MAG: sugar transferase, partial [Rubrivivax sp.]|nr:sugar transferase [Rubrivivax sp.]
GDPQALARGLLSLAANPQAAMGMGKAGREAVERRFSMQAMVDAYERVYEQVLQTPASGSK